MIRATFTFPQGFLWGCATSSHQVEGNNINNDWWAWEQEQGRILNGDRSGKACDWWAGRWREDFDRAKETWQNAQRISIEWSRVQPEPDRWDEGALDRYRQMLMGLKERGMVPMVTLHHFTNPLWLTEMGGWENDAVVELFGEYTRKTVEALKAHCDFWVTINEPNVYMAGGYLGGGFVPGKNDVKMALKVLINMVKAHARAYEIIHELQSEARVGIAHHWRGFMPANKGFLTRRVADLYNTAFDNAFAETLRSGKFDAKIHKEDIPQAKDTQDFFGINYYGRQEVKFDLFKPSSLYSEYGYPKGFELSDSGFVANDPEGFRACIRWAHSFGLPIYITENGTEDSKDTFRRKFLVDHILAMWHEISHNVPVKGYFHWSLVDNFEWNLGWERRFGLWQMDEKTQQRTQRDSGKLYAEICRTNSLSWDAVEKFAPELYEHVFGTPDLTI